MTTETKREVWQNLMDSAYTRWQEHKGWTYEDMMANTSAAERAAVLLGNLNYQVENGGFTQWVDNGYALKGKDVVKLLEEGVKTPTALELARRVKTLLRHVKGNARNQGFGEDYWRSKRAGRDLAEAYDSWYYDTCQPALMPEIEAYLAGLAK